MMTANCGSLNATTKVTVMDTNGLGYENIGVGGERI